MRSRDHHKKKAIKYNSKIHWDKYKSLRNKANIQLRESKAKFYHKGSKRVGDCAKLKDFKNIWSLINSLTSSLGPVYEFVCISFRTDNLNCFRAS